MISRTERAFFAIQLASIEFSISIIHYITTSSMGQKQRTANSHLGTQKKNQRSGKQLLLV